MRTLATTLLTVGLQLALGTAVYVAGSRLAPFALRRSGRPNRRLITAWQRGARTLVRALPVALGLVVAGSAVAWLGGVGPLAAVRPWISPLAFLALGALPVSSAYVVLQAGELERRGRLRLARRQIRLGGQLMFLGVFSQLVLMWTDLLFLPRFRLAIVSENPAAALLLAAAMLALGCAAFVALLAGLSGKPRPSGHFAALLYLTGLIGTLVAAQLVMGGPDPAAPPSTAATIAEQSTRARLFIPSPASLVVSAPGWTTEIHGRV